MKSKVSIHHDVWTKVAEELVEEFLPESGQIHRLGPPGPRATPGGEHIAPDNLEHCQGDDNPLAGVPRHNPFRRVHHIGTSMC